MSTATSLSIATKAKLFRGLADTSRLAVLECLRNGPKCVTEVVDATGLSQPGASAHLSCLRDCGLIEREPRGRFAYYSLADPGVDAILLAAEMFLGKVSNLVDQCPNYEARDESAT
jgi:DNA-binding transcriptional ArsR family regulator